ncbi:MAG TPA: thioredoxin [Candidatus Krumholzibacteria bacterium]|nr:thioredoxin [Candidatus Krumholzibacteria bacterium]HRX51691.1 thioredoxin [Candidatus Krumholzibacteria bacterium]
MSGMIHVTDENFEAEVLQSDVPVLVDFSATWCGPCKQLKPIVEELAGQFDGRIKVAHVDVDQARNSAMKFGVMSVPTVLYMKGGKVQDQQIGLTSKDKMVEKINALL